MDKLTKELKARGIKQKDFAERIAIQQSHLSETLKGTRNISDFVNASPKLKFAVR